MVWCSCAGALGQLGVGDIEETVVPTLVTGQLQGYKAKQLCMWQQETITLYASRKMAQLVHGVAWIVVSETPAQCGVCASVVWVASTQSLLDPTFHRVGHTLSACAACIGPGRV